MGEREESEREPEREFDLRWAEDAELKEPSARARMLAERWRHEPPRPQPFRAGPERVSRPRSPWRSVAVVFGIIALVIVVLGYGGFGGGF
jgi:hypothetical protein